MRVGDFLFLLGEFLTEGVDVGIEVGDTGAEAFEVVFEVFDFKGKFAAYGLYAVDFGQDRLELVEGVETALDGEVFRFVLISGHAKRWKILQRYEEESIVSSEVDDRISLNG